MMPTLQILVGDALDKLRELPSESVHCCVTSPPYWGLRDYSTNGQLGLEKTPEEYIAKMVEVFREVRRVLRKDGTLWLNMGDSYASGNGQMTGYNDPNWIKATGGACNGGPRVKAGDSGLKPKDLCGIPWRLALALQADGWYLRCDIIWAKPNPMPESVTDRPTKAHEYIFLLTKSQRYFYDAEAIREPQSESTIERFGNGAAQRKAGKAYHAELHKAVSTELLAGRNKRSVWTIATQPYPEAHFATFPEKLPKICILAGTSAKGCCAKCGAPWERIVTNKPSLPTCKSYHGQGIVPRHRGGGDRPGGYYPEGSQTLGWQPTCKCQEGHGIMYEGDLVPCPVLDPFAGSGTTGQVALELGRSAILIELSPKYADMIRDRCNVTTGLALA